MVCRLFTVCQMRFVQWVIVHGMHGSLCAMQIINRLKERNDIDVQIAVPATKFGQRINAGHIQRAAAIANNVAVCTELTILLLNAFNNLKNWPGYRAPRGLQNWKPVLHLSG